MTQFYFDSIPVMLNSLLGFQPTGAESGSILGNVTWAEGLGKGLTVIVSHGTEVLGSLSLSLLQEVTPSLPETSERSVMGWVFSRQQQ